MITNNTKALNMAGNKRHQPLTDLSIRQLKYDQDKGGKLQYHADSGGLTIKVTANNSKLWQLSYRFAGKQYHISLGAYPAISLADARAERDRVKALLAKGIDPKESLNTSKANSDNIFENVANKWLSHIQEKVRGSTLTIYQQKFSKYILPALGQKAIENITKRELVELCESSKDGGQSNPAYVASVLRQIFNYCEDAGLIEVNPASSLTRLFKQIRPKGGFAAQTDKADFADNLRKIQSYCNNSKKLDPQSKIILQLLPFTALRVTTFCQLKWSNIDLETGKVNIEAIEGNKTTKGYCIYFGTKTLQLIKEYQKLGLDSVYCFPPISKKGKPYIDRVTISRKLANAGINLELQSVHGFRKCLKTLVMSQNPNSELKFLTEKALGHSNESYLEQVYNKSDYDKHYKIFWQYVEDLLIAIRDNLKMPKWEEYQ